MALDDRPELSGRLDGGGAGGAADILPRRHFVYPVEVEEVERGALELMVRPAEGEAFLATCALGFASPAVPTGVWNCPDPAMVCAVAGGYGYMIDSGAPGALAADRLSARNGGAADSRGGVAGFCELSLGGGMGPGGAAVATARLSWEGVRLGEASAKELRGWGWEMRTDKEMEFVVDLATGKHTGGPTF